MSLTASLNTAATGLLAAARGTQVVSENVANGLTEGYAPRRLDRAAALHGGVRLSGVTRQSDPGLLADRRLAESGRAAADLVSDMCARLERLAGPAGSDADLTRSVAALEGALVAAAADPVSAVRLTSVVDGAGALAGAVRSASDGVQSLRTQADDEIARQVESVNAALGRIADLNGRISTAAARGAETAPLVDRRQAEIDGIAGVVPVREIPRENGQVALLGGSGQFLLDGRIVRELGFEPAGVVTAGMTLAGGALSGLSLGGRAVPGGPGAGRLAGGSLGAAFEMRDVALVQAQAGLDALARDLVERFAEPTADPGLGAGEPGLFTDAGGLPDPARPEGLAGRLRLNPLVDPSAGGDPARLRDGLGATAPALPGDPVQLQRLADTLAARRTAEPDGPARSVADLAAGLVADLGAARLRAEERLGFEAARWEGLKQAELARGVDTDAEMQTLLRLESSYAANGRVIQAADAMLRRLLEI